ncbi:MAG: hypothetical protein HY884_09875 [Deltaproteobacteria bacterium]|nr:hypothetical protein [Deltaproteobacteria bacterium]
MASSGIQPLEAGVVTTRKGRNIYKNGTDRQLWTDEKARELAADEKHGRGKEARAERDYRKGIPQTFEQAGQIDATIKTDAAFAKVAGDVWTGTRKSRDVIAVGRTPEVLKMLGAKDLPLTIAPEVIEKAGQGKHKLPLEAIKALPVAIRDPLMIFDSAMEKNALVVLLGIEHKGKPVIAALHLDKIEGRYAVNRVASVHGKEIGEIRSFLEKRLLRYWDEKRAKGWFQSAGLQFYQPMPIEGTIPSPKTILSKTDLVKYEQAALRAQRR